MKKIIPYVWGLAPVNRTNAGPEPCAPPQYTEGVFIIARAISKVCFCMTTFICHTKTPLAPACCQGLFFSKVEKQKKIREVSFFK